MVQGAGEDPGRAQSLRRPVEILRAGGPPASLPAPASEPRLGGGAGPSRLRGGAAGGRLPHRSGRGGGAGAGAARAGAARAGAGPGVRTTRVPPPPDSGLRTPPHRRPDRNRSAEGDAGGARGARHSLTARRAPAHCAREQPHCPGRLLLHAGSRVPSGALARAGSRGGAGTGPPRRTRRRALLHSRGAAGAAAGPGPRRLGATAARAPARLGASDATVGVPRTPTAETLTSPPPVRGRSQRGSPARQERDPKGLDSRSSPP